MLAAIGILAVDAGAQAQDPHQQELLVVCADLQTYRGETLQQFLAHSPGRSCASVYLTAGLITEVELRALQSQ